MTTSDQKHFQDCSHMDFYNLSPRVNLLAQAHMKKYGVGTCGPRQFYGTFTPHETFEKEFSEWMGCEASIIYSSHHAASSSIPLAFVSNHGCHALPIHDVPFSLEFLRDNKAIMGELTRNLSKIAIVDARLRECTIRSLMCSSRNACFQINRGDSFAECVMELVHELLQCWGCSFECFLFIEGIYESTGEMCNLGEIMGTVKRCRNMRGKLRDFKVILDDTMALGIMGENRKGTWEYFGERLDEFYLVYSGLHGALCAPVSVCYGARNVVNHQRLGGSGYTFSASPPTINISAAIYILNTIIRPEYGKNLNYTLSEKVSTIKSELLRNKSLKFRTNLLTTTPQTPFLYIQIKRPMLEDFCKRIVHELGIIPCVRDNCRYGRPQPGSHVESCTVILFFSQNLVVTEEFACRLSLILKGE